jgi:hypothetical protein
MIVETTAPESLIILIHLYHIVLNEMRININVGKNTPFVV